MTQVTPRKQSEVIGFLVTFTSAPQPAGVRLAAALYMGGDIVYIVDMLNRFKMVRMETSCLRHPFNIEYKVGSPPLCWHGDAPTVSLVIIFFPLHPFPLYPKWEASIILLWPSQHPISIHRE